MKSLSQRQFAKEIGRSHVWVSKLVKEGKLPLDAEGRIPVDEGMKAYQASQRVGYDGNRAHGEKQRQQAAKTKGAASKSKAKSAIASDLDDGDLSPASISVEKVNAAFNKARLAEKTFQAKLKELEYKEAQGILIPREEVESDAANTAEELRGLLFAICPRIAPLCEGKPAREIERLIEEEINVALGALKKSKFMKK